MKRTTLALCVALSLGLASQAVADLITFTHAGQGSITGTLDGVPFVAMETLITATADNDNRQSFGDGFFIENDTANISIPGLGCFDFVTKTLTFVNHQHQIVGFSRAGFPTGDLMNGPTDPSFASWDMLSSIGPITGPGDILQWTWGDILTTGGLLEIDDVRLDITFTAVKVPDCVADLDGDGTIGVSDLLSLLANWGPCKGCPADFDGNDDVGVSDLCVLLANWGPCP